MNEQRDKKYYFEHNNGEYIGECDVLSATDDIRHNSGNYYNNLTMAQNNILADKLMWRLRQWQAINDNPVNWTVRDSLKFYLYYSYETNRIKCDWYKTSRSLNEVYFSSKEKAEEALKIFKDELTWYFTEYQQRLDEPMRKAENK